MQLHNNAFCSTIFELWMNMTSHDFARTCGFVHEQPRTMHLALEDEKVARAAFRLCVHTTDSLALTDMTYRYLPPLIFVGLISEDTDQVAATFQQCRELWDLINKLEEEGHGSSRCRSFVQSLMWPEEQWTREILVRLSENELWALRRHVGGRHRGVRASHQDDVANRTGLQQLAEGRAQVHGREGGTHRGLEFLLPRGPARRL